MVEEATAMTAGESATVAMTDHAEEGVMIDVTATEEGATDTTAGTEIGIGITIDGLVEGDETDLAAGSVHRLLRLAQRINDFEVSERERIREIVHNAT